MNVLEKLAAQYALGIEEIETNGTPVRTFHLFGSFALRDAWVAIRSNRRAEDVDMGWYYLHVASLPSFVSTEIVYHDFTPIESGEADEIELIRTWHKYKHNDPHGLLYKAMKKWAFIFGKEGSPLHAYFSAKHAAFNDPTPETTAAYEAAIDALLKIAEGGNGN